MVSPEGLSQSGTSLAKQRTLVRLISGVDWDQTGRPDLDAVVDLQQLKLMTSGDAELAAEALGIFRSQAEVWGPLLDPKQGAETWADACHAIKGAARSVGAMDLGEACANAETLGRSGEVSPAQAGVALSEVKDRLGAAIEAIAELEHKLTMTGKFPELKP